MDIRPVIDDVEQYYEGDFEVCAASEDALLYIRDHHQALAFAWPTDDPGWDPLLVNATTANALITIYYMLSTDGQEKFVRMLTTYRADFITLVGFTWSHIK